MDRGGTALKRRVWEAMDAEDEAAYAHAERTVRFRPQPQVPENSLHSLGRLPLSPASDHHGQASPFAGYHPQAPGQSPFSPFGGSPAQHAQHAQHPQHYPQHQQQQQGITSPFTGNHSAPFETASYNSGNGQPSPTAQYPTPRARVAAFEGTAATLSEEDMQARYWREMLGRLTEDALEERLESMRACDMDASHDM